MTRSLRRRTLVVGPLLIPLAVAAAGMSIGSDASSIKGYVEEPRGTLYWGGAGLDGAYLKPQLRAFQNAGIKYVDVGLTNSYVGYFGLKIGPILDAIRSGVLIRYEDSSDWTIAKGMTESAPQFNLVGYSYGSLLAAQTANFYANRGYIVDHLVLIGSPIDGQFLHHLRSHKCVKKLVVVDLTEFGDPLHAGMTVFELAQSTSVLQEQKDRNLGEGHFYYAHSVADSPSRWRSLAQQLVKEGLA